MKNSSVMLAAAAAALLFGGCDRAPGIAGPESDSATRPSFDAIHNTTNEMDLFWGDEEQDPCTGPATTGDMVTIQGSTHFLFVTTFDDNGGFHVYTRANSRGTGMGVPSLLTYSVKEDTKETMQSNSGGAGG